MRSAAPSRWEQKSTPIRGPRWLVMLLALSGACSVYNSDMLGATTGITTGGQNTAGGGLGGAAAGTSNAVGGKPGTDTPSPGSGGEGGDPNGSGLAGADTGGSTNVAGTASVAGTGGTGGTSETGGTGGTSGSGGSGEPPTDPNLIDDFEDQNLTIKQSDTRGGVWYLFDNGTTGTTGPVPLVTSPNSGAPAALGDYSLHITATGFTGMADEVGSGLGVDFRNQRKVYDGSKYAGIRFWAKVGTASGKNKQHRVQIADATTDKAGGKCSTAAGKLCDDHFGIVQTFTTSWAQYTVRFDKLTQLGWGNSATALDKAALYGLQITAAPKAEVDLWLDQIEFF